MNEKKKWYEKSGLIIFLLIVFPPLGLIGLFLNKQINKIIKVILYVIFSLWGLIFVVAIFTPSENLDTATKTTDSEIKTTQVKKTSKPKITSLGKWYSRSMELYFELLDIDGSFYMTTNDKIKTKLDNKTLVNKSENKYIDPNNVNGEYYVLNDTTLQLWNANGKIFDFNNIDKEGNIVKTQSEIRKDKIDSMFSAWDGSHIKLSSMIKQSMNDPKSYEHIETKFSDKGDYIILITKFRGKNAFGGLVVSSVTAKSDLDGNIIEVISQ